jgi:hypothetical protein
MEVPLLGLEVEQHEDEQIQDQDGAGVDDDLHDRQELGVQQHEEPRHMPEEREQGDAAVHRVPERHRQHPRHDADQGKVGEDDRCHA